MGNSCGKLTETGHLLRVHKLTLQTPELSFAIRQLDILTFEVRFVSCAGALQQPSLQRAFNRKSQYGQIARLNQIIRRSDPEGITNSLWAIDSGDHDHGGLGITRLDLAQKLYSVAPGHHHVGDHQRKSFSGKHSQCLIRRGGSFALVILTQEICKQTSYGRLVVNDQDAAIGSLFLELYRIEGNTRACRMKVGLSESRSGSKFFSHVCSMKFARRELE